MSSSTASAPFLPRLKVAILGDAGVGKSSLIRALKAAADGLPMAVVPGADDGAVPRPRGMDSGGNANSIEITDVVLDDVGVRAQLWECCSTVLESRAQPVIDDALIAILAYDVGSYSSFASVCEDWLAAAKQQAPAAFIMMVGCKIDRALERVVQTEQADAAAQHANAFFIECSAREATNISLILRMVAIRASAALRARDAVLEQQGGDGDDIAAGATAGSTEAGTVAQAGEANGEESRVQAAEAAARALAVEAEAAALSLALDSVPAAMPAAASPAGERTTVSTLLGRAHAGAATDTSAGGYASPSAAGTGGAGVGMDFGVSMGPGANAGVGGDYEKLKALFDQAGIFSPTDTNKGRGNGSGDSTSHTNQALPPPPPPPQPAQTVSVSLNSPVPDALQSSASRAGDAQVRLQARRASLTSPRPVPFGATEARMRQREASATAGSGAAGAVPATPARRLSLVQHQSAGYQRTTAARRSSIAAASPRGGGGGSGGRGSRAAFQHRPGHVPRSHHNPSPMTLPRSPHASPHSPWAIAAAQQAARLAGIPKKPLVSIDVRLENDRVERLHVCEGDNAMSLAREFVRLHGLKRDYHAHEAELAHRLALRVQEALAEHFARLERERGVVVARTRAQEVEAQERAGARAGQRQRQRQRQGRRRQQRPRPFAATEHRMDRRRDAADGRRRAEAAVAERESQAAAAERARWHRERPTQQVAGGAEQQAGVGGGVGNGNGNGNGSRVAPRRVIAKLHVQPDGLNVAAQSLPPIVIRERDQAPVLVARFEVQTGIKLDEEQRVALAGQLDHIMAVAAEDAKASASASASANTTSSGYPGTSATASTFAHDGGHLRSSAAAPVPMEPLTPLPAYNSWSASHDPTPAKAVPAPVPTPVATPVVAESTSAYVPGDSPESGDGDGDDGDTALTPAQLELRARVLAGFGGDGAAVRPTPHVSQSHTNIAGAGGAHKFAEPAGAKPIRRKQHAVGNVKHGNPRVSGNSHGNGGGLYHAPAPAATPTSMYTRQFR